MSISTELTRLEGAKSGILATLEGKGVAVPDDTVLDGVPTLIDSIEVGSGSEFVESRYYLRKIILTKDNGYQVIKIPVVGGQVVDLGEGEDVAESTRWSDEIYHAKSHPAMTFDGWTSPIELVDNTITIPSDVCIDYTVGGLYSTADGLLYIIGGYSNAGYTATQITASDLSNLSGFISAIWLPSGTVSVRISEGLTYLQEINIPAGVTTMYPALYSTKIKYLVIPESLLWYDNQFRGVSYLRDIALPVTCSTEALLGTFMDCVTLEYIYISEGATGLGNYVFQNCFSLRGLVLPATITIIGQSYLSTCTALRYIVCKSTTPPGIYTSDDIPLGCAILVPSTAVDAYKSATNWSSISGWIRADTPDNRISLGIADL